jgi:hypothetical protein
MHALAQAVAFSISMGTMVSRFATAVAVLLTFRMFRFFKLQPELAIIMNTIIRAFPDITNLVFIMMVINIGFAQVAVYAWGSDLDEFSSFSRYIQCIIQCIILYSYSTHTLLILYSYCTHTVLILYSYCSACITMFMILIGGFEGLYEKMKVVNEPLTNLFMIMYVHRIEYTHALCGVCTMCCALCATHNILYSHATAGTSCFARLWP